MRGNAKPWSQREQAELDKYFKTNMTEMTLYLRLQKLNPDRSYEGMMRRIRLMREQGHTRNRPTAIRKLRVGYLDIEATDLNANFGFMISWYIKKEGKNEYDCGLITKKEIFDYKFDERILKELLDAFKNYDVLYTHYGSDRRFDLPFIRTRAFAHNLEHLLPDYMDKFIMDTYPIARNKLKLHSNRLESIAQALGIENVKKTPLLGKQWFLAKVGHPESLQYIYLHNKRDVQLLERVHKKLSKVERPIYKSM